MTGTISTDDGSIGCPGSGAAFSGRVIQFGLESRRYPHFSASASALARSASVTPDPGHASSVLQDKGVSDGCVELRCCCGRGVRAKCMNNESKRFLTVLQGVEPPTLTSLCQRTLDLFPASGASIVLMSRDSHQSLAGASGMSASTRQDLEFTLGQGPGVDAYADGMTVLVEDLRLTDSRWPLFSPAAEDLGLRSVCSLPLKVGRIRLGVLNLYGNESGSIGTEHLEDAQMVADLIAQIVIGLQSEATSEVIAFALDESDYRAVVHQATGMISAQLDCGVDEALVRLRAHAFATERPIEEIAEAVVTGSTRFDDLEP